MLQSLRGRLLVVLLAVAAIGLVALGAITYGEQRSFLFHRVDNQVRSAFLLVDRALDEKLAGNTRIGLGDGNFGPRPDGGARAGRLNDPGRRRNGLRPGFALPPSTYGIRRNASGKTTAVIVLSFRQTAPPAPALGSKLKVDSLTTVRATGGSGLEYRVLTEPYPGGGTTTVAVPLGDTTQTLHRLLLVEAIVIAGVLLIMGVAAWILVGVGLRPLDRMGETADAIAEGHLTKRVDPADQRTEIGRLGLALNRMLARLESAFTARHASEQRLRQFLADAAHELRTPLSSIRGYAELQRIGATADPAERERAISRIESEAARMGVLVDDLLALARLDATSDRERQTVDIAAIARNAVDDAKVTEPNRKIKLEAGQHEFVYGDPDQLQQVVANLMHNALVHTPQGTPIVVTVKHAGDDVRLDLRDFGPGLPPGTGKEIFERFWRAENGRKRGKAGSGLGLAIVSEIVTAHDGRVSAGNADGGGAQFTVWLPLQQV